MVKQRRVSRTGVWPIAYVDWYEEPARARTIINNHQPERFEFPAVLFGVLYVFRVYFTLYVFFRDAQGILRQPIMHHIHGDCSVCLTDEVAAKIQNKKLTPQEAFWNTTFHFVNLSGFNHAYVPNARRVTYEALFITSFIIFIALALAAIGGTIFYGIRWLLS